MANQREDAGTDSWWETYQPFFFLQAQAEEEVKGERADILNELRQEKEARELLLDFHAGLAHAALTSDVLSACTCKLHEFWCTDECRGCPRG